MLLRSWAPNLRLNQRGRNKGEDERMASTVSRAGLVHSRVPCDQCAQQVSIAGFAAWAHQQMHIRQRLSQTEKRTLALPRFWRKVRTRPNGCWEWVGYKNPQGYGQFGFDRKVVLVHRFSYETFVGIIPSGKEPDHLCRNRSCVNYHHIELVSHQENIVPPAPLPVRRSRRV